MLTSGNTMYKQRLQY